MEDAKGKVLTRLQNQCAKKECCSSDVLAKALKALDGDMDAAREILASLVKDSYVDDFRYASAFARDKASLAGWGPVKIRFALAAKKIDRETVDRALEEVDPQKADDRLERLVAAKKKTLEGDPQIKLKLIKFALARGYGYDKVASVIEKLLK